MKKVINKILAHRKLILMAKLIAKDAMWSKYRIIILLLFGMNLFLKGQSTGQINSILPLPFENINLFTDRDLYLSGETIWFSAVISLEDDQQAVSKIIYIELFNADQKSIVRKKYEINQGFSEGALDIPAEFLSDVYYLRAYTHYNKNFPAERYFITALQIINPKKGMPVKTETKAFDKGKRGQINIYSIAPAPPKNGMQIVSVSKIKNNAKNNEGLVNFELLNNNQQIISRAEFSMNQNPTWVAIHDSIFTKTGLYYYILKDQQSRILKVHAFIYKDSSETDFKFNLSENEYRKRSLVNIDLNKSIFPAYSRIGIKIALKGSVLSSGDKLKLFMEDPFLLINYLKTQFNPLDLDTKEDIATLEELNRELNREEYKDLLIPPYAYELEWMPEIRDFGLNGIVIDKVSQKPLPNIPIYLSITKDRPQVYIATSEMDGSFQFFLNKSEDNLDAFLCPLFENIEEIDLKVNREFTSIFPAYKTIPMTIDSSYSDLIDQMLIASQTTMGDKKLAKQDFSIQNLPYSFDDPEASIKPEDYIEIPTLAMIFKELMPSVRVRKQDDIYKLFVFDIENELLYKNPLILLDEVPVFDIQELLKIPTNEIEKIEVHYTPFFMEKYTIYGIISISTLKNNFGGMIIPKTTTFFEYQTLSPSFTFGTKIYAQPIDLDSRLPDFRTLLHWNPSILLEADSQLNFYTSDQTGTYEAYIFGNKNNGQAFQYKLLDLEVKD